MAITVDESIALSCLAELLDAVVQTMEPTGFDGQVQDLNFGGGLLGDRVSDGHEAGAPDDEPLQMKDDADAILRAYRQWLGNRSRQCH